MVLLYGAITLNCYFLKGLFVFIIEEYYTYLIFCVDMNFNVVSYRGLSIVNNTKYYTSVHRLRRERGGHYCKFA